MLQRIADLLRIQPPLNANRGLLRASGATVPTDGDDGYQPGCIFQDTTNGIVYVNEGSITSADFNALGDLTTVDYSAGNGTAITISGTYTTEGIFIDRLCTRGMRVGAFASSGAVTGAMILNSTTPTAVEIHGGVATDQGSGANLRPLRSRFIVNLGSDARIESETYGIQGQLVVKESNLGHWHAGVLGTLECQTTLVVSNVLAGVAAVTGRVGGSGITVNTGCFLAGHMSIAQAAGVTLSGTAVYAGFYATMTGSSTNFGHGIYTENVTVGGSFVNVLTPDSTRTNAALVLGAARADTASSITMATTGAKHCDPVQMKYAILGSNPDATSTVNLIYQSLAHSTDDMANLRLKGSDWTIDVQKDLQDVYCYQGEVDITTNTVAIGGEAAALGLTMSVTSGHTGNVWNTVMVASTDQAAGILATLFLSHRGGGTIGRAIYIEANSGTTVDDAIYINAAGTITNFVRFAGTSNGPATVDAGTPGANSSHKIKVDIAGTTGYIAVYADY